MSGLTVDCGDVVRLYTSAPFSVDGTPTDPDTVQLIVQKPNGTQLVYDWPTLGSGHAGTLTHNDDGDFEQIVEIDQDGPWAYRWVGSGAAEAAEEGRLYVRRPSVVLAS